MGQSDAPFVNTTLSFDNETDLFNSTDLTNSTEFVFGDNGEPVDETDLEVDNEDEEPVADNEEEEETVDGEVAADQETIDTVINASKTLHPEDETAEDPAEYDMEFEESTGPRINAAKTLDNQDENTDEWAMDFKRKHKLGRRLSRRNIPIPAKTDEEDEPEYDMEVEDAKAAGPKINAAKTLRDENEDTDEWAMDFEGEEETSTPAGPKINAAKTLQDEIENTDEWAMDFEGEESTEEEPQFNAAKAAESEFVDQEEDVYGELAKRRRSVRHRLTRRSNIVDLATKVKPVNGVDLDSLMEPVLVQEAKTDDEASGELNPDLLFDNEEIKGPDAVNTTDGTVAAVDPILDEAVPVVVPYQNSKGSPLFTEDQEASDFEVTVASNTGFRVSKAVGWKNGQMVDTVVDNEDKENEFETVTTNDMNGVNNAKEAAGVPLTSVLDSGADATRPAK